MRRCSAGREDETDNKGGGGLQQDIESAFPAPLFAGLGGGVMEDTPRLIIMQRCAEIPSRKYNEWKVTESIEWYGVKLGGCI